MLSFDERGHQKNQTVYFVYGSTGEGEAPEKFYPTTEMFIGEGGSYLNPEAVRMDKDGVLAGTKLQGKEAAGGMRFAPVTLKPQETVTYLVLAGVSGEKQNIEKMTPKISRIAVIM